MDHGTQRAGEADGPRSDNKDFLHRWRAIKQANKSALRGLYLKTTDAAVNRQFLIWFDVQVKRLHE